MHHDNWATFLNEKPLDNICRQIKFYLFEDVSMNGKTIYMRRTTLSPLVFGNGSIQL
jgi:hypothetical protein